MEESYTSPRLTRVWVLPKPKAFLDKVTTLLSPRSSSSYVENAILAHLAKDDKRFASA